MGFSGTAREEGDSVGVDNIGEGEEREEGEGEEKKSSSNPRFFLPTLLCGREGEADVDRHLSTFCRTGFRRRREGVRDEGEIKGAREGEGEGKR